MIQGFFWKEYDDRPKKENEMTDIELTYRTHPDDGGGRGFFHCYTFGSEELVLAEINEICEVSGIESEEQFGYWEVDTENGCWDNFLGDEVAAARFVIAWKKAILKQWKAEESKA